MVDRPPVSDEQLARGVRDAYGLSVSSIEFLSAGNGTGAGVFRASGNGDTYFLKAKMDGFQEAGVLLTRILRHHGIEEVVAPLPTITGRPWGRVNQFGILVYPYIDGVPDPVLSDQQWVDFGALMRRIHATPVPQIGLDRDDFASHIESCALLRQAHAAAARGGFATATQTQFAALLTGRLDVVERLLWRAEALGRQLQGGARRSVICHADLHLGNLLVGAGGSLHLVDWEQPLLAPIERDLVFVTDGAFGTSPQQEALFAKGYGLCECDPLVMAYYRYSRAVEDLSAFAHEILFADTSEASKQVAAHWARNLFKPGGLIAAADNIGNQLLPAGSPP